MIRTASQFWTGQLACGGFGQSLTATEHAALYNALRSYMLGVGVVTYDADTNAVAAAFATPPTTARKSAIDNLITGLKASGHWAKLDLLYLFAAADAQAAKINWKAPASFVCTEVNAPTFTANQGFTGNGTSSYLDTNWIASTNAVNYTLNLACVFAYSGIDLDPTNFIIGNSLNTVVNLQPRNGNFASSRVNGGNGTNSGANADATGLFTALRDGATSVKLYKSTTAIDTGTSSSPSLPTASLLFLRQVAAYSACQIKAAGAGLNWTSADNGVLKGLLDTYFAAPP